MSDPKVPSWVMLFAGVGYRDRHLTILYPKIVKNLKDEVTDDGHQGFNDKASSVIYCIARGVTCQLWEDKEHKGRQVDLKGTGDLEKKNLKEAGFHNKASCVIWKTDE